MDRLKKPAAALLPAVGSDSAASRITPAPVLLARMRPAHGADVPPAPRTSAVRTLARQWPYTTGSGVEGVAWRGDRRIAEGLRPAVL